MDAIAVAAVYSETSLTGDDKVRLRIDCCIRDILFGLVCITAALRVI